VRAEDFVGLPSVGEESGTRTLSRGTYGEPEGLDSGVQACRPGGRNGFATKHEISARTTLASAPLLFCSLSPLFKIVIWSSG